MAAPIAISAPGGQIVDNAKARCWRAPCNAFASSLARAHRFTGTEPVQCPQDVWCEVIPPFNLMPRQLLEGTCNAVLAGVVNSLLPLFMRRLAADYEKWVDDEGYRRERASRRIPLS